MKLSASLLLLAGAATCASAQWSDYLNKILKSGEKQVPLKTEPESHVEDRETLVARKVWNITAENWFSLQQPEAGSDGDGSEAGRQQTAPIEWYYYFTSTNVN